MPHEIKISVLCLGDLRLLYNFFVLFTLGSEAFFISMNVSSGEKYRHDSVSGKKK